MKLTIGKYSSNFLILSLKVTLKLLKCIGLEGSSQFQHLVFDCLSIDIEVSPHLGVEDLANIGVDLYCLPTE